jgi:GrpB-like predicted nucleotidyltransferase (UPF0157 family)
MPLKVEILPYDSLWPQLFSAQAIALRQALGDTALRIDHIGSTSVPGLAAKPVTDIQISVRAFEPLEAFQHPLEGLGYVFRANNSERTKRYFREVPGTRETHIHVRRLGSWAQQFALLFRDYLRLHPDDANAYAALKRQLAEQYGEDRQGYTDAKDPFIWQLIYKADRWSQVIGWEPGPSDA